MVRHALGGAVAVVEPDVESAEDIPHQFRERRAPGAVHLLQAAQVVLVQISSYCSRRWARVGTQMTDGDLLPLDGLADDLRSRWYRASRACPWVITLPRKPLVKERSWPIEPTIRLTSSQCWPHDFEQYSTVQPQAVVGAGHDLGRLRWSLRSDPCAPPVSGPGCARPGGPVRLRWARSPRSAARGSRSRLVHLTPHRDDVADLRTLLAARPRMMGR